MWFVSNQDTNVVAGPLPMANIPPSPDAAAYLVEHYPGTTFLPGTFVASAVEPPNVTEPVVPAPQGLEGIFTPTANHSVRGLAHDGNLLYVADEVANEVKAYDAAGQLCWAFAGQHGITIKAPVHLLYAANGLFIGSAGNGSIVFVQPSDLADPRIAAQGIKQLSGIALDPSGTLYATSAPKCRATRRRMMLASSASHSPSVRPSRSAINANSDVPAREHKPVPSARTSTVLTLQRPITFTVNLLSGGIDEFATRILPAQADVSDYERLVRRRH